MSSDAFELLGLDRKGVTEVAVKKAYATKLKQIRPDEDREGFMALRQAYEMARQYASHAEHARAARRDAKNRKRERERARTAVPAQDSEVQADGAIQSEVPETVEVLSAPRQIPEAAAPSAAPAERPDGNGVEATAPPPAAIAAQISRTDDAERWQPPAQVAMEQVQELIAEPWRWQDPAAWREIVDQDALQPIDDFQEFERQLRGFVCAKSGLHREETPDRQQWMTDRVLHLLDERFGWTRGSSRNPWEHAEFHWLYSIYETCDWFSERIPAASQFSTPTVAYGETQVRRPFWLFHPAMAVSAAYGVSFLARYMEIGGDPAFDLARSFGPWAPFLAYFVALFSMVALVPVCLYAITSFLAEVFLVLRREAHLLFRWHGPIPSAGWFTLTDWLSLVIVILAIVLIERQIDPPASKTNTPQPPAHSVPNT